eukprot:13385475-Alexandrium_andersonii.AAC.1
MYTCEDYSHTGSGACNGVPRCRLSHRKWCSHAAIGPSTDSHAASGARMQRSALAQTLTQEVVHAMGLCLAQLVCTCTDDATDI